MSSDESSDDREVLQLDGLEAPVLLTCDEEGYRKAQRLLNRADSGIYSLTPADREKLNAFIRTYQTDRFRV